MADYYPVLTRAVSSLPNNNAQARRELYDRARTIVMDQLRRRDPGELTPETAQERAALEVAIRRVETESRAIQAPAESRQVRSRGPEPAATRAAKAAARPSVQSAARSTAAAAPPKPAASYLARILEALQPSDGRKEVSPKQNAKTIDTATAQPTPIDRPDDPDLELTGELGGMLKSLATMMLALTYCVAALAVTGVVYFRGSVMVAAGIIGYPVLLLMTVAVVCLFVVPPWVFLRKTSGLPKIGFLFRAIHSASRPAS